MHPLNNNNLKEQIFLNNNKRDAHLKNIAGGDEKHKAIPIFKEKHFK